ncbi:MAG TPA: hypothetical protein VIL86_15730, partial [Tepidisphaeraceae bacterium]
MTATPSPQSRRPFCKLADPNTYVACSWDLTADEIGRLHWVEFFKRHLNTILGLGIAALEARGERLEVAVGRADLCKAEFFARFDAFANRPNDFGRVTILTLDA